MKTLRIVTVNMIAFSAIGTAPLAILNKGNISLFLPKSLWIVVGLICGVTFLVAWKDNESKALGDPTRVLFVGAAFCTFFFPMFAWFATQALCSVLPAVTSKEEATISKVYILKKTTTCQIQIKAATESGELYKFCASRIPHPNLSEGQTVLLTVERNWLGREIVSVALAQPTIQPEVPVSARS